jgi:hypothetical protein
LSSPHTRPLWLRVTRVVLGGTLPIALVFCARGFLENAWMAGFKDQYREMYVRRVETFGAGFVLAFGLLVAMVVRMINDWDEDKPREAGPLFSEHKSDRAATD